MLRLLFEKKGRAVWISHLDLMRVFKRAFKRAGLPLTHTQGYNPRPSVSIALPLSVGVESVCELLDFELEESFSCEEICERLNQTLIEGVSVLQVYGEGKKIKNLAYMRSSVLLEYDEAVPDQCIADIRALFNRSEVMVEKKSKNGMQDQNIVPMIRELEITRLADNQIQMDLVACCQNPSLNPMQLAAAITRHLPEWTPAYSSCCRKEIYDFDMVVFR